MSLRGFKQRAVFAALVAFNACLASAATVQQIVPTVAPRGARVILVGSGLDAPDVAVTFPVTTGTTQAMVVSRSATLLELVVPSNAATGAVQVANASGTMGSVSFTLALDPTFSRVTTFAGSPNVGGTDATPGVGTFAWPTGIAVAPQSGNVFLGDSAHNEIRLVTPSGAVSAFAGALVPGSVDGTASAARFNEPTGLAYDSVRQILYVADTLNHKIRKIAADGAVSTLAGATIPGSVDGTGTAARFNQPTGLAVDASGNVYVCDTGNNKVRKVTPAGIVTSIAGNGTPGFADGQTGQAKFSTPVGIAIGTSGTLYVCDMLNKAVRKIESGIVSTIVRNAALLQQPVAIGVGEDGNLYVTDTSNDHVVRINLAIAPAMVTTFAGSSEGYTDGTLTTARFHDPTGIVTSGVMVIADTKNDAIRIVSGTPTLADIYPSRGPLTAGTTVRIFGTGFVAGGTQVKFGTGAATSVTVVAGTEILATVPAGNAGAVDVTVTTSAGTATLAGRFTYVSPPTIGGIQPAKGPSAGGTGITISGANFALGDTSVTIGGAPVLQYSSSSSGVISVLTPPGAPGNAPVVVATTGGTATLSPGFTYFGAPAITSVAPTSGLPGTLVTITGQNFDPDATGDTLRLGAQIVPINSATAAQLTFIVPALATSGKLAVTTPGGVSQTVADFVIPVLTSISLTPLTATIFNGKTQAFTATGRYTDDVSRDLTTTVTWASSNTAKATIAASGVATAVNAGSVAITASLGAVSGTAELTVQPLLTGIQVAPASATVVQGATQTFAATASYDDGTTTDISAAATWTSTDTTLAIVSGSGVATGIKAGSVTIGAAFQTFNASAQLTIQPIPTQLALTPAGLSVAHHATGQLTATLIFSDGTTQNVTATATWTSSAMNIASVAGGTVTGTAPGSTTIAATSQGFSATASVIVMPVLQSIAVIPSSVSLNVGQSQQLIATATYSDASTSDVTATAAWTTSATGIAAVSATGLVTTTSTGSATISATVGTITGTATVTVTNAAPTVTALTVTPSAVNLTAGSTLQLAARATYSDGAIADVTTSAAWSSSNTATATVSSAGLVNAIGNGSATITAQLSGFNATATTLVAPAQSLPPDSSTVASPIDRTVATFFPDSTAFLYTGANPIQTSVAPGTINPVRATVLRGRVIIRGGEPLPGVRVTVLDHPELGQTLSRADGAYDLVLNGGGGVSVRYVKTGYVTADRLVTTQWNVFKVLDDVALVAYDPASMAVNFPTSASIAIRSSQSTDASGSRRATLIFRSGTTAFVTNPDGSTSAPASLTLRATELTVGANGPKSMPAALPPASAYTYCVELSADEATNAKSIYFSHPVAMYVENFIGFPVGTQVPLGYYDRTLARWAAADDGRVIKIVSISNGLANVDVTGDDISDDPATFGIDESERQQLASLYGAGQTLWRVSVDHFTPWDLNWPMGLPFGARRPALRRPRITRIQPRCDQVCPASTLGVQNQTLHEEIPIVGTPFALEYDSSRQAGAQSTVTFDVSEPSLLPSVKRIDTTITVAGRAFHSSFPPTPNLTQTFTWDHRDAYGRLVQGTFDAVVTTSYVYDLLYDRPLPDLLRNFGQSSALQFLNFVAPSRAEYEMSQSWTVKLGEFDVAATGFGGWTFSAQGQFDPTRGTLLMSGGNQQDGDAMERGRAALFTVGGVGGPGGSTGDGGPALNAKIWAFSTAVAPDGSVYVSELDKVRKIAPNGTITTVAGGNGGYGFTPDGQPAATGHINAWDVAVGPDGSVYIDDMGNYRIRRIDANGLMTTIAGNGAPGYSGDGGRAVDAAISPRELMAVGPDGSVYFSNSSGVRRVSPDGIITTVAGCGGCFSGPLDNVPARQTQVRSALGLAVGADGTVYYSDLSYNLVRAVTPDGMVHTIAGKLPGSGTGGLQPARDGEQATSGGVGGWALAVAPDKTLLIGELGIDIRAVSPDGIISTLVGNGQRTRALQLSGGLARGVEAGYPWQMQIGPDGSVYYADGDRNQIRKTQPIFTRKTSALGVVIPAEDLSEAYVFTDGRHAKTVNPLNGVTSYTMSYDAAGKLTGVTDMNGNVTVIERDGAGNPTAIVSPGNQRTTLSMSGGRLSVVTNPAGEATRLSYDANGYLGTLTDPRNGLRQYTFNFSGRLTADRDATGAVMQLTRTGDGDDDTVTLTTAEGYARTFRIATSVDGDSQRTNVGFNGLVTSRSLFSTGATTSSAPDGSTSSATEIADSRFGMQAPVRSLVRLATPLHTLSMQRNRSVTLSDPLNPLSVSTMTETATINGRSWTSTYTASTRQLRTRSPAGREVVTTLDPKGRPLSVQVPGIAASSFAYDSFGHPISVQQGNRSVTLSYDARHELTSVTDPLARAVQFSYDDAGRITSQTQPGGRVLAFTYDSNGNMTSLTPPSRPAHMFTFTPVDLPSSYAPPTITNGGPTTYTYDRDRRLTIVQRPEGETLSFTYDSARRLSAIVLSSGGAYTFGYDAATGKPTTLVAPGGESLSVGYDGFLATSASWSGPISGSVNWTYDNDLRVASENGVSLAYDADGLLTSAGLLTLARSPQNGLLNGTTLAGVTDSWLYDEFGQPAAYTASYNGSVLFSQQYTRDAAGRITTLTETTDGTSIGVAFTYDVAGRLTGVTRNGAPAGSYTYDANGNRLTHTGPDADDAGAYDAQDRLLTYGPETYSYNANGEQTSMSDSFGSVHYDYDEFGNLVKATLPHGSVVEYVLDAQQRRVGRKVDGVLTNGYLYGDRLRIVAELDGSGAVVARFVYGTRGNVPDYVVRDGATYRIISDHLGSPRVVINTSTGQVAERIDYDEFGNITNQVISGSDLIPFRFAGGLYDVATGLTHFGAREYDAYTGRWLTKDPLRFAGRNPNLYNYASGDPINIIDPSGLEWTDDLMTAAANFSAGFGDAISSAVTFGHYSTKDVRRALGIGGVDECSGWYTTGKYAGYAEITATMWAAGLNGGSNSVFWSGYESGARYAAEGLGGTTLEETLIGGAMDSVQHGVGFRLPDGLWSAASSTFARNASGEATAVIYNAGSTWTNVEAPILASRGIPVRIITLE